MFAIRATRSHSGSARVILAEDDKALRDVLAAVLRKAGYEVVEAADGTRLVDLMADELLQRDHLDVYDLIISDVRMPRWTGLEVLRSLRAAGDRTPVLLITAFGDSGLHQEALRLGVTSMLDKPFDLATFRASAQAALRSRAA